MKFFQRFGEEPSPSNEDSEDVPFPAESPATEETFRKSEAFGWFSLTAEDHANMGSTLNPNNELRHNPGKAQYEVMTDKEIERVLDDTLEDAMTDNQNLIDNGRAQLQKDFFIKSLAFLRGVGRLPKKFEDFDVSVLPDVRPSKKK